MNVKLKGKPTPENWHIMASRIQTCSFLDACIFFVYWQHVKNEKPDKSEYLTETEFESKYEILC